MGANCTERDIIKKNYDYIWIDSNINNKENFEYSRELIKRYPNISFFNNVEEAINLFKGKKYCITYIIVSGSLFGKFIYNLENVIYEISSVPKIIIFTSESTKPKIKNMSIINDSFYNVGGFVIKFEEVLSFLNKNSFVKELNFTRALRRERMGTGGEFSFELLLESKNDLVGPIYLSRLFKEPEEKHCKIFDKYLIDNYGDIMKELISQIYNVSCPISLRIKYWLRAYTLETKFYKDMNANLMKDNIKPYIPYIQLLYSGSMINNFTFSYTNKLYRGALIKKEEINNLIKHKKKIENPDNPGGLIYSKAFMSFSLDKKVAIDFMQKKNPTEKEVRVLYILTIEKELIESNTTNADLRNISFYENEREILLFPFSVYEINDEQKEDNYYIIFLNNLEKYRQKPNIQSYLKKNQIHLIESINKSTYIKMLQNNGLLPIILNLKLIVVRFVSIDQLINYLLICHNIEYFTNIEEMLYDKYPYLVNRNLFFLVNGNMVKRSKTLEQNNIKDNTVILVCEYEFF